MINRFISSVLKPLARFVYYSNERKKVFREIPIRKRQNQLIKKLYPDDITRLIVFVVDGANWFTGTDKISGGILSIASIYDETVRLKEIHQCEVIMMTYEKALLLEKHTQFDNNIPVFRFAQLYKRFKKPEKLIIHIPEFLTFRILDSINLHHRYFQNIKNLHVNILNQRSDIMPDMPVIDQLRTKVSLLTQTTAHDRYCNKEQQIKYRMPVHKLSVFASPEKYRRSLFEQKENIIAVSPDEHPLKQTILDKIKSALPDFQIVIIRNLRYPDYLKLIASVKFTITFGEGLDFYFIETAFSGGVAIAVYNDRFFTPIFKTTDGVFPDYPELEGSIENWLINANEPNAYSQINAQQHSSCSSVYKYGEYINNLVNFYKGLYTYS